MIDPQRPDLIVGVVGAGAMGRGIAQVAAVAGCRVKLFDAHGETAAEAVAFIGRMLARAAEKGRMSAEAASTATTRIETIPTLRDLAEAEIVIEAVIEDLEVKHAVFRELEELVGPETILATNTSALSVTAVAAGCAKAERVAGLHFFNPVPLMKLVEVVAGVRSAPEVVEALMTFGRRLGRTPIRVADAPGFVVNQVGRGYGVEAAAIAAEGAASFADIDRILREGAGFPMGPFTLMDLTGLDVTQPASELIYRQSFDEPRFRPVTAMALRRLAGLLGRKSDHGYYRYDQGRAEVPDETPAPAYDGRPVWISSAEPAEAEKLRAIAAAAGARLESAARASESALILVTPLGEDATAAASAQGLDPKRTVAVDCLLGLETRRSLMGTPIADPAMLAAAHSLLGGQGVPATVINDCAGFVAQRVIAMIVNIGCAVAQAGTASPADIDQAVTLGLGYPYGPLAFGDHIGAARIFKVLTNLHRLSGDPRYRPTPWLRRRATLGVSLSTPEPGRAGGNT